VTGQAEGKPRGGNAAAVVRDVLGRVAAVLGLVAYMAGPGYAIVASPQVPEFVRWPLLALTGVAVLRPTWSAGVLLLLVPLLPVWPTLYPTVPPSIVHLVVVTQVVPWLVRRAAGRRRATTCSAVPAWGIFVAVAAVSVAVGLTPDRWRPSDMAHLWRNVAAQVPGYLYITDTGDGRALPLLIALIDGFCCIGLVSGTLTRETRVWALRAAAIGAILTALFGFVQAQTGIGLQTAWRIFDAGIIRINATYVDPNALAAFYALVAPVIAGLAMARDGWRRGGWCAGLLVVVAAMVMTAGRAGLVSMAFGFAILACLALRRDLDAVDRSPLVRRYARPVIRGTAGAAVITLAAVIFIGTLGNIRHEQQTSYLHTWLYTFNLRQPPDAIAKGRIAVWQAVIAMIRTAPVTGLGLGNSINEFERFRARLGIESLPADARLSAHNTYLLVTSELGLLGLAAWLLMLVGVGAGMRATGNVAQRQPTAWPVAGLVAGLAGYTLTMLTGDRIILREDIIVGTLCAAIATLGSGPLPRVWKGLAWALLVVTLASWPVRAARPSAEHAGRALPPDEGLHGDQVGVRGDRYRWSKGYAVLYLPPGATRVRVPVRNLSPGVQRLDVFVDGRPTDQRDLPRDAWVVLEYRLAPLRDEPWHRVALQVNPTWQAPNDPRVLGVVVGEWTFEPH
jgi:O-antigen ligase